MKKLITAMMVTLTLMFGTSKLFSQTTDYVRRDGSATRVTQGKDSWGRSTVEVRHVSAETRQRENETAQNIAQGVGSIVYAPAKTLLEKGKEEDSSALKAAGVVAGIVATAILIGIGKALFGGSSK